MEELFSNLLYLVPLAVFIFLRISGARKKAQSQGGRPGSAGRTAPRGRVYRAAERPAAPVYEPAFTLEPEPAVRAAKKVVPEVRFSVPSVPKAPAEETEAAEPGETMPAAPAAAAVPLHSEGGKKTAAETLSGFTPLKRAVVASEILGRPKGL